MNLKMKMKAFQLLPMSSFIGSIFLLSSCEKVINVDLNESSPHIVIVGVITDSIGPYTVRISESGSYFNQPVLPPVSRAVVIISSNSGIIDTLKETEPGSYLTSKTVGLPGTTYTLRVIFENQEYSGVSTMQSHVSIDSLVLEKGQSIGFGFGGGRGGPRIDIHAFFKDPPEKNFYRLKVYANDTTSAENYRLYDDQYTNGEETDLRVGRAIAGDKYLIELYSLDMPTYEYYRTLEDILRSNPIFGSTPANPNTNLSNGALGYFGAYSISTTTLTVTDSMINRVK
jgi:hypothetical protein